MAREDRELREDRGSTGRIEGLIANRASQSGSKAKAKFAWMTRLGCVETS